MSKESIESLSNVIEALGNIEVRGKTNLLNLGGCIAVLEEIRQSCLNAPSEEKE